MKSTRPLQQCIALLRDSTRCGKYAKTGETLCAVHQPGYTPQGAAVPRPKTLTHQERLELFARSNDERVAMQAIGMLERLRGGDATVDPRADYRILVAALTATEREQLTAFIMQFQQFKEQVYVRRPDLRPALARQQEIPDAALIEHQEPPGPTTAAPVKAADCAGVDEAATDPDELIEVNSAAGPRLVRRSDLAEHTRV
jgi:hypothetical protein